MIKTIDLSGLMVDGIISEDAMWEIFKLGTNWLGEFYNVFPDTVYNGDSFMYDGKVYQCINDEICHTGCVLLINRQESK